MLPAIALERMLSLFLLAQIVHIVRWRWSRPSGYLLWFTKIWLIVPVVCLSFWLAARALYLHAVDEEDLINWFGALVGYVALCGAYVMIYPAISELSPSLEILRKLDKTPKRKMPIEGINIVPVAGANSVIHRVHNLESSQLIVSCNDVLKVTPKGRWIAAVLTAYRDFLGIEPGAGG